MTAKESPPGASPKATTTFLLTDVEGSTRLWEANPSAMSEAMARHDAIVQHSIAQHGGELIRSRGEGDSAFAVFRGAGLAVVAAVHLQRALLTEAWPQGTAIRVRAALHTGESEFRAGDYYGSAVNRCARLRAIAHGGQVVVSRASRDLVADHLPEGVEFRDLGRHLLKDLADPEQVFQLCHPDLPDEFPPLRGLEVLAHNLPVQLTSFIGRAEAMSEVKQLLRQNRLVTLTGTGGCGKTRLALQVGAEVLEDHPEGVWFVELAAVSDPGAVPQAIALALGLRDSAAQLGRGPGSSPEPRRPSLATVTQHLGGSRALIVLDNCEHLVARCAEVAESVLTACPNVSILATSREILGARGELTWRVPSLSTPDPAALPPLSGLPAFESVGLFIARARLHQPDFALTPTNAIAVARICHRVDGIPLAIELAAARVMAFSVEQVAERLASQFDVLSGGARTVLSRQQTLRAAIDWSHRLLDRDEQVLFRRLSVFVAGWTMDAAEAVCPGRPLSSPRILDLLSRLVDKSLVIHDTPEQRPRYRLLDTIRQYALEKLDDAGEAAGLRDMHADWHVSLAESAEPELSGPAQVDWLNRLEAEHDNLRGALGWTLTRDGDHAQRLATALAPFWFYRGHFTEARKWLDQALARASDDAALRSRALTAAGRLAVEQADYDVAARHQTEALAIARATGDQVTTANALRRLSMVRDFSGDTGGARELLEEGLEVARASGDPRITSAALIDLGQHSIRARNLDQARLILDEGLSIARRIGHQRNIAESLLALGEVESLRGDGAAALTLLEEGLDIARDLGEKAQTASFLGLLGDLAQARGDLDAAAALQLEALEANGHLANRRAIISGLESLARIARNDDRAEAVARLAAACEVLRGTIGSPGPTSEQQELAEVMAWARRRLGDEAYARITGEAGAMSLEETVSYAETEFSTRPTSANLGSSDQPV